MFSYSSHVLFNCRKSYFRTIRINFAIGVAIGMAKKNDGAVALAGALGYAMVTKVLNPENVATLFNIKEKAVNLGFTKWIILMYFLVLLSG